MLSTTMYLISVSKFSRSITCFSCRYTPFSMSFTSSWTCRAAVCFLNSTLWTTTATFTLFSLGQGTGVSWVGSRVRCVGGWEIRPGEEHFRSSCTKPSARSGRGHAVHRQLPPGTDTSRGEPRLRPSADIKRGPSRHLWEPRSDGSTDSSRRDILVHQQTPESLTVKWQSEQMKLDLKGRRSFYIIST